MLEADDVRLLTEIGFLATSAGLRAQAAGVFEALVVLRPHRAFAYVGMAALHLDGGRADEAVTVLEQGRRMVDGRSVDGSSEAAAQWCEDRMSIRVFLGLALDAARRHGQATRTLRTALELAPGADADGAAAALARGLLGMPQRASQPHERAHAVMPARVKQSQAEVEHDGN